MDYLVLRHLHVTCVTLSGLGFLLRGVWMLIESPRLNQRWVRIVPHVLDTALLGSAIAMAVISSQYPLAQNWLTAQFRGPAARADIADLLSLWAGQAAALARHDDAGEVLAELVAGLPGE